MAENTEAPPTFTMVAPEPPVVNGYPFPDLVMRYWDRNWTVDTQRCQAIYREKNLKYPTTITLAWHPQKKNWHCIDVD